MELIFEGYRLAEGNGQGVNFIGRYTHADDQEQFVICRVTRQVLEYLVKQELTTATELVAGLSIPKTLSGAFCSGKQNRTMIESDGWLRKHSAGICLELLPIAAALAG
jgi:hypothetical protein